MSTLASRAAIVPRGGKLPYAGTIFHSAFRLLLVQPIIARQILPWFGCASSVWTTCLVFFRSALLAGYAYADATSGLGGRRRLLPRHAARGDHARRPAHR